MLDGSRRWLREQFAFLIVVVGIAVGFALLLVEPGSWRVGAALIGAMVIAGGLLRLVLPTAKVGFLAVRIRGVDAVLYLVIGVLILVVDLRLRA